MFVRCNNGHTHWGRRGAAGWLSVWDNPNGPRRFLLVRRANCHNAGFYSIPGGALEPGETPAEAARREVVEEGLGDVLENQVIGRIHHLGCGGWYYRTVVGVTIGTPPPLPLEGPEHDDLVWVTRREAFRDLPLHPGLYIPRGGQVRRDWVRTHARYNDYKTVSD